MIDGVQPFGRQEGGRLLAADATGAEHGDLRRRPPIQQGLAVGAEPVWKLPKTTCPWVHGACEGADPDLVVISRIDDERVRLAERYQVDTGRGQLLWPPTSQTIIKRFNGYWNDALSHVGFRVQTGRKRGGLKFSDQDYLNALRNFATWASRQSISPSYKAYQAWVKECGDAKVPSGAAIRQRFGSWRTATQQANI